MPVRVPSSPPVSAQVRRPSTSCTAPSRAPRKCRAGSSSCGTSGTTAIATSAVARCPRLGRGLGRRARMLRPARALPGHPPRPPGRLRFPHRSAGEASVGSGTEPVPGPLREDPISRIGSEASTVPKSLKVGTLSRMKLRLRRANPCSYAREGAIDGFLRSVGGVGGEFETNAPDPPWRSARQSDVADAGYPDTEPSSATASARPRSHPRVRRPDARLGAGAVTWSGRSQGLGSSLTNVSPSHTI